jgi:hypothetical protein
VQSIKSTNVSEEHVMSIFRAEAGNQDEADLLNVGFLLDLFLNTEDGGGMLL